METFNDFIRTAQTSLNQHDSELEALWIDRQKEIREREDALRDSLIALLLLWPFGNDKRRKLQTRNRGQIRTINRRAAVEVEKFQRDILRMTVGGPDGWRPFRTTSNTAFEFSKSTNHTHVWDAMARGRMTARDLDRIIGPTRPGITGPDRPGITGEPLPRIAPRVLPEMDPEFRRRLLAEDDGAVAVADDEDLPLIPNSSEADQTPQALEDLEGDELVQHMYEVLEAALDNPEGNTRNRSRQMKESVRDMSYDRTMSRAQVVEQVNGNRKGGGFRLNENNMKLSTLTHARSAYRLSMLDYADKRGINHFMLEYPAAKRASMSAGGIIAQHAHQIRTLDQWSGVYKAAAKGKFSAANATLGFHHNDFTTLVPIPASLLDQAKQYSKTNRGRLIKFLSTRAA